VGFYVERVLPHIMNRAMDTAAVNDERRRCLKDLAGTVLEIGLGSGLNLPYYPPAVTKVVGVDPSATSSKLASKRIAAAPFPVETIGLSAEKLPVADASFPSIVSTFTLCSIPDVRGALLEVRRALAPGGRFHFVEHGRAPDADVERWQNRLNSLQKRLVGGCHLNRDIQALIEQAGFRLERLERRYLKGAPRFGGALYVGVATRR
jgi:ubiquinone/menaquinone biosynthesis C-methylase UbiE